MNGSIVWGIVPARGGSKGIPRKNLALIAGRPLLDYTALAAKGSGVFTRIFCSSDDRDILARATALGLEADVRPPHLASDDANIVDAVRELLDRSGVPDIVVLLQPTSPFVLPEHLSAIVHRLEEDSRLKSAQTIVQCPHRFHAVNQREYRDGLVAFRFAAERALAYNKQRKTPLYALGNALAARGRAVAAGEGLFAEPSFGIEIGPPYDLDIDTAWDLELATVLVQSGTVTLPHMTADRT